MDRLLDTRGRLAGLALLCVLGGWTPAGAQVTPVVRHAEGSFAVAAANDREWVEARPGRPVGHGERLWVDRGARAELQVAGHTLRVGGQTQLAFDAIGANATRISVQRGTVVARVPALAARENFEVDTPNLALRAAQPGHYRVDVDPRGTTRVTVFEGLARIYGQRGESQDVKAGQRVSFQGRNLALSAPPAKPDTDDLDRWVVARETRAAPAASATHVAGAAAAQPVAAAGVPRPAAKRPIAKARSTTATARAAAPRPAPVPAPTMQARGETHRPSPRAEAERRDQDQENWLRYNHGLPPLPPRPAPLAIPIRRVG